MYFAYMKIYNTCFCVWLYIGAGFNSKQSYGSGSFHMRIKAPPRDCAGVVTAFYVIAYKTLKFT